MDHIAARLEELSEVQAAADLTRQELEARRAEILKSVQAELEALDAEFAPLLAAAEARIEALKDEIKSEVLEHGASVRGGRFQAVYSRGRITWDTHGLEAYADAHPEVYDFRREGSPSVSLRQTKE
jgi:uncharacterized protein YajQ (UPF0234 family)